jgi:predicted GNAT family acetyltransferase
MPASDNSSVVVRHNPDAQRFETVIDGQLCRADYRLTGNVLTMHHTEVPQSLQGRGIAGQLVRAAIEHARAQGLRIAPHCPYVETYMRRHPEAEDVLA